MVQFLTAYLFFIHAIIVDVLILRTFELGLLLKICRTATERGAAFIIAVLSIAVPN
jgi:hypothetical protein